MGTEARALGLHCQRYTRGRSLMDPGGCREPLGGRGRPGLMVSLSEFRPFWRNGCAIDLGSTRAGFLRVARPNLPPEALSLKDLISTQRPIYRNYSVSDIGCT